MIDLAHELLIATSMVVLTALLHLIGLDLLLAGTRVHLQWLTTRWVKLDRLLVPLGIVLGLFVLHGLEIWAYAAAYRILEILPDIEQALYFSTSAYSTVGETGALLPPDWRILGVLESINGMLLIGWSTAFLFHILDHLLSEGSERDLPPRGAIARARRRRAAPES